MIGKCANPVCPTHFHHRYGGKFFRFRREPSLADAAGVLGPAAIGAHNVEHYWLCARCCQMFTLAYVEGRGVVIKPLREDLPAIDSPKELTAA